MNEPTPHERVAASHRVAVSSSKCVHGRVASGLDGLVSVSPVRRQLDLVARVDELDGPEMTTPFRHLHLALDGQLRAIDERRDAVLGVGRQLVDKLVGDLYEGLPPPKSPEKVSPNHEPIA